MLSFDPDKPFAGVNLGLQDAFKAQTDDAALAQYMTDEQFKNVMSFQDPRNNLATQRAAASATGNVPQLRFGGNTFAEGLGNGINNYLSMRGYNQQQAAYRDIAEQQRAYQQQQVDAVNRRAAAQHTKEIEMLEHLKKTRPDIARVYELSDPAGRNAILSGISTKTIDIAYKPDESKAETAAKLGAEQDKLNWQRERFHALTGVFPEKLFAMGNQGALTPQMQSAWRYVYDSDPPKDALDFKQRYAQVASSVEGARGATIDNQTRGPRNQANLDSTLLSNAQAQVNAKYAEALKQADYLLSQGKVDEANKLKQTMDEGMARWQQIQQHYDQMTQGQIDLFNSQNKAMGLPYALPDKQKLKAVTRHGKVTQFYDPYTGQIKLPGQ